MTLTESFARTLRLRRLFHGRQRLLVVALDHPVTDGPIAAGENFDELLGQICRNGADAVVLHKGRLRHVRPHWFDNTALVLHLSASTRHSIDPDDKYLMTDVAQALRLGADAVSVQINLGSRQEARQIADLAKVADACARWQVPLLAMVYARGPKIINPHDSELVAHGVTLAAELGADMVKTVLPDPGHTFAEICRASPIPVLVAGGPPLEEVEFLARMGESLTGGAAGVVVGRNVFQAADPGATTAKLAGLVHGRFERL